MGKKGALLTTTEGFGENTTIHGLYYIFTSQKTSDRIFWGLLVLCFTGICVHMSVGAFRDWEGNPILTTINRTNYPIKELEFPAVTICSPGLRTDIIETILEQEFQTWSSNRSSDNREELARLFKEEEYGIQADFSVEDIVKAFLSPKPDVSMKDVVRKNAVTCKIANTVTCEFQPNELPSTLKVDLPQECFMKCHSSANCVGAIFQAPQCWEFTHDETVKKFIEEGCDQYEMWLNPAGSTYSAPALYTYTQLDSTNLYYGFGGNGYQCPDCYEETSTETCKTFCDLDPICEGFLVERPGGSFPFGVNGCYKRKDLVPAQFITGNEGSDWIFYQKSGSPGNNINNVLAVYASLMAMVIPPSSLLQSPCNDIQYSGSPDTSDDLPILDLFINPNRADEIEHLQETLTSPIKDYIKTLDDILLEKILNLIKFAAQPCFPIPGYSNKNLLKKCEMQGVEIDCAELFRQVITDSGICCGLNNQDVIKKSKYLNMLNLSDTDFSPEVNGSIGLSPSVGKSNGIRLTLDKHSGHIAFGTLYEDSNGINVITGPPGEFPMMMLRGNTLPPGHEHSLELSGYVVSSEEYIRSVSSRRRQCYFKDEKKLGLFNDYSYSSCKMECAILNAEEMFDCIPWYLPKGDSSKMCDPWITAEFRQAMETIDEADCDCLPDCNSVVYSSVHASAPFRGCDSRNINLSPMCITDGGELSAWIDSAKTIYQQKYLDMPDQNTMQTRKRYASKKMLKEELFTNIVEDVNGLEYDAFKEDIAVVNIYFTEPTVFEYSRSLQSTIFSIISSLGGIFSLFLGFSLVSFIEIFYWFIIKLSRAALNQPKKTKPDENASVGDLGE